MPTRQFTTAQLLRRSLTPSSISGFLCVVIGLALTITHIVLLSLSVGTSLPGVLDGQWSVAYTEAVVRPLSAFFANNFLNKLLVAGLWGAVGLGVYMGFEYAIHAYNSAKEAQRQVALSSSSTWQKSPLQGYFLRAVVWRVGVIVATAIFLVAMQPLLAFALDTAPRIVTSQNLSGDAVRAVGAALVWMLLFHGLVVLLRLYTMRTRLFGDDKLY